MNKRVHKRAVILSGVAVIVLLFTIWLRVFDGAAREKVREKVREQAGNDEIVPKKNMVQTNARSKPVIRTPERGFIPKSVEELARKIVEGAPNKEEAFGFLVEAKSFRIQALRTRRAKEKAEEQKSQYDAEFWKKKRSMIDEEVEIELGRESVDTQAGVNNDYVGNENEGKLGQVVGNKVSQKVFDVELNEFLLRAITKVKGGYQAQLAYKGKYLPAKKGYMLFGEVLVDSVTANSVTLSKGGNEVNLYAF